MPATNQPIDPNQAMLDHHARMLGFPDYATWAAWNQHRTDAIVNGSNTTTQQAPQQSGNFLTHLLSSIPFHPAAILGYVRDRYAQATGQDPNGGQ